jgi:hypothetical protein
MSVSDGPGRIAFWSEIQAFARHAEAIGLDSVWVCDHFLSSPPGGPVEGIHEGWTILSALAASTPRVEVGSLVMCNSFRNPALLAKMAVTADAVSEGRLVLGLGAGWYDAEYVAFGYPTDHRVSRFEEALAIITALLSGDSVTFSGRYYRMEEAALLPPPQRPIPILVAGKAPRMLRAGRAPRRRVEHRLVRQARRSPSPAAVRPRGSSDCRRARPSHAAPNSRHGRAGSRRGGFRRPRRRAVPRLGLRTRRSPRRVRGARL